MHIYLNSDEIREMKNDELLQELVEENDFYLCSPVNKQTKISNLIYPEFLKDFELN